MEKVMLVRFCQNDKLNPFQTQCNCLLVLQSQPIQNVRFLSWRHYYVTNHTRLVAPVETCKVGRVTGKSLD